MQNTVGRGAADRVTELLGKAKAICQAEFNSHPTFTVANIAKHLVALARSREAVKSLSLLLFSEIGYRTNSTGGLVPLCLSTLAEQSWQRTSGYSGPTFESTVIKGSTFKFCANVGEHQPRGTEDRAMPQGAAPAE